MQNIPTSLVEFVNVFSEREQTAERVLQLAKGEGATLMKKSVAPMEFFQDDEGCPCVPKVYVSLDYTTFKFMRDFRSLTDYRKKEEKMSFLLTEYETTLGDEMDVCDYIWAHEDKIKEIVKEYLASGYFLMREATEENDFVSFPREEELSKLEEKGLVVIHRD